MALSERIETPKTDEKIERLDDRPLNLYADQVPDMRPQIRKLDLEWLVETAADNVNLISSAVLVGSAVGLIMKRKPVWASCFALGFILQQTLLRRHPERFRRPGLRQRDKTEIQMERYAMKAQLGDYGKLEVIPFK